MRIARFGIYWGGAYNFGKKLMEDDWQSARPSVAAQTSGASGVFDFFSDDNFPLAPVVARRKFAITAATSAALEDSLDTLRATIISEGRTKLWWLDRDGSTKYWMWAKCTSLKAADTYQERGRWLKKANIEFLCPEGLWYAETDGSETGSGIATVDVVNNGNYPALLQTALTIDYTDPTLTVYNGPIASPGAVISDWAWSGTTAGIGLTINARDYVAMHDGSATYDDLTIGATQLAWIWLPTGTHQLVLGAGAIGGTSAYTITWRHTHVF